MMNIAWDGKSQKLFGKKVVFILLIILLLYKHVLSIFGVLLNTSGYAPRGL